MIGMPLLDHLGVRLLRQSAQPVQLAQFRPRTALVDALWRMSQEAQQRSCGDRQMVAPSRRAKALPFEAQLTFRLATPLSCLAARLRLNGCDNREYESVLLHEGESRGGAKQKNNLSTRRQWMRCITYSFSWKR